MSADDKRIQAAVDRLILDQGAYSPVELLMALGRLPYEQYEAWRSGELEYLEDALSGNLDRIVEQLGTAAAWATRLGLRASAEPYHGWSTHAGQRLRLARSATAVELLRTHYRRARASAPQMDLFLDGGAEAIVKDLGGALAARNRVLAEQHLQALLSRQPEHRLRPAAEQLCDALGHLEAPGPQDPAAELAFLDSHLAPLARKLLGHRARDYLAPFWRRLGQALEGHPFDPTQDHLHPSWAYAQCLDWQAVHDSVLSTAKALEHPALLGRLAEATRRLDRRLEAIGLWCDLCRRFPDNAATLLGDPDLPDTGVRAAWESYHNQEQVEPDPAWFPAWLLLTEPGLARALPQEEAGPASAAARGFRVLQDLLSLAPDAEHREQVGLRRELQEAHPGFLTLYLERRGGTGPGRS